MYTDKKNILQLVALLEAHGITKVVLCPGSRNTPIVHTLSNHPNFTCYAVTDERSAGYFAIGLALNGGKPAAVCCTSGTALLNLHPAVAEAFYQNVPLVVISADRPAAWIGQMDGQTVPQPGVFQTLVKKSVNLPEIHTEEDEWYCNRLVNEALLETNHHGKGPVHINVPISEPLFQFTVDALPEVRVITRYQGLNVYDRDYNDLVDRMNKYQKRMIIIGQMNLIYLFEKRYIKLLYKHFAWLTEHIGNQTVPGIPVKNFDAALYAMPEEKIDQMVPELLITYGGHVVSKRLKKFLRQHPPKEHWHVSPDGEVVDLYGSLTTVIEMDPFEFLEKIASLLDNRTPDYPRVWENYCKIIPEPEFAYSEMLAVGTLLKALPESCALHLANSSVVRYAQLYSIPSKEWGNISCTCSCSQKCLVCGEDQGYVCLDALCAQNFNSFESFYGHRDFNNHVWMDGCDLTAFFDHAFCIYCGSFYLAADRSVYDLGDLFDDLFEVTSFFCDQGRVGGNAADNAHVVCFFNVLYFCCVDEKSHVVFPPIFILS